MTDGQQNALRQLKLIAQEQRGGFDVERVHPPTAGDSRLCVEVGLRVGALPAAPGGIQLRAWEQFQLFIPPDFPFAKPEITVGHARFAGKPHVQWTRQLCLYQSATEWNASDGMFGLMQRLCDWLTKAAANQLDPDGQPLHPPAVYADHARGKLVVPAADTPDFDEPYWLGMAELRESANRVEIVAWHSPDTIPNEGQFALAVLFRSEWPWEFPTKGDALFREFEKQGVAPDFLLRLLGILAADGNPEAPLYVVVGTPMRGIAGGVRKQHLAVWSLSAKVKEYLALTTPRAQDTAAQTSARARLTQLLDGCLQTAALTWCPIMEGRAEVTVRRDSASPLARLKGRAVAIWGCGALGAPIAMALCRAGVSRLVLVDSGRVSPGLLVRQPFRADDVGTTKVTALEAQLSAIRSDLVVEKHYSNAALQLAATANWAAGCDLVIDATASELLRKRTEQTWNRSLSNRPPIASLVVDSTASRLLVAFVDANASGATWDAFRKTKLALLRNSRKEFADAFFPATSPTQIFQPEPGCSEPTFQGSAADAASMAATGLNLIAGWFGSASPGSQHSALFAAPNAGIPAEFPLFYEFASDVVLAIGAHEVRIAPAALKEMRGWIEQNRRKRGRTVETGGLLWGEWDEASQVTWLTDASGPPADSQHSATRFLCGQKGTASENKARQKHSRNSMQYVGMWHTHPVSEAMPSSMDYIGMSDIFARGPLPPTKNLLCIIGRTPSSDVLGAFVFVRELDDGNSLRLRFSGNHFEFPDRIL